MVELNIFMALHSFPYSIHFYLIPIFLEIIFNKPNNYSHSCIYNFIATSTTTHEMILELWHTNNSIISSLNILNALKHDLLHMHYQHIKHSRNTIIFLCKQTNVKILIVTQSHSLLDFIFYYFIPFLSLFNSPLGVLEHLSLHYSIVHWEIPPWHSTYSIAL